MAPAAGFEPATIRLTVGRSTTELRRNRNEKENWTVVDAGQGVGCLAEAAGQFIPCRGAFWTICRRSVHPVLENPPRAPGRRQPGRDAHLIGALRPSCQRTAHSRCSRAASWWGSKCFVEVAGFGLSSSVPGSPAGYREKQPRRRTDAWASVENRAPVAANLVGRNPEQGEIRHGPPREGGCVQHLVAGQPVGLDGRVGQDRIRPKT